jgi:hypothetical protein
LSAKAASASADLRRAAFDTSGGGAIGGRGPNGSSELGESEGGDVLPHPANKQQIRLKPMNNFMMTPGSEKGKEDAMIAGDRAFR